MAKMAIFHLLPLLAFSTGFKLHDTSAIDSAIDLFGDFLTRPDSYMDSIGVRARRAVETEDHPGFKIFALPFVGVEIGVKGNVSVGEAFVQVENLKRLVPEVDLKKVKVHVKFESFVGSSAASLNYQLEASDGHGTEEGAVKIARELRKDGTWEVTINTENPLALTQHSTLISKVISNLNVRFLGDYKMKTAQGHYSNPTIGHDFRIKFVQSKFNASSTNKEVAFEVEVENNGEMYTGEVAANLTPGRPHKVLVKINKGKKTLLQMQLKIEQAGWTDFNVQGKFILAGVEQGKGYVSFKDNMFKVEVGSHQVRIEMHGLKMGSSTPKSVTITLENEGKVLWSFKTLLECKSSKTTFHKIFTADVSGPKKENLAGTIRAEIFVNEAKEFKIKFDVVEDERIFVDFIADTTTSPYRLSFAGPHLFKELGLPQKEYTLTVNHQKGSSLVIDVNILGDLHFDFKRAANTEGGSSVGILATQAGVELFKYQGETMKVDNEEMLKIGFEGSFDFGQDVTSFKHSLADASFVKRVDANRKVNFGLTWFKKEKNVVLNKFHIDAKVEQDGFPVFDLVIATDKKPFRFFVLSSPVHHLAECMRLTPFLFPCNPPLHDVMYKVDLEAEHDAGKSLEVVVKHPQGFKGFKLTRDGDEAEVVWDGKRLGKGEFSLTERRFQVSRGPRIFTVNWGKNTDDIDFLLNNKIHLNLVGMDRNLDVGLDWGMHKLLDFDLATPENIHLNLATTGGTPSLGNFTINRNLFFRSLKGILEIDFTGDTMFSHGSFAAYSPIHTEIKASYNTDECNLSGDFKKVIAGKEYGVSFPKGIYAMPTIKFPSGLGFSVQLGTEQ